MALLLNARPDELPFGRGLITEWLNGSMPDGSMVNDSMVNCSMKNGKVLVRKTGLMKLLCMLVILVTACSAAKAQINRYLTRGNQLYEQQNYKAAAADYAKALAKDPTNTTGMFNLGNSYYQQKQYDSSRKIMEATARMSKDKNGQAAADYNIGNSYLAQRKWDDAINAYKETLRRNPQDPDAKYNLAYAREMAKKDQQQNKDNKDKNKQDKKDQKDQQKQDKKDQDKDKKDKDKQQQDDKDQKDNKDKDQQEPQGQPSKLSQQQAEQLLNALQQEEKKLQDKMKKEKGVPMKMQKDW